ADLDGDGDADVALAARATPGGVVLLRNRGDGSFDDPVRISLERETRCVQAVDFDGDGRLDLLLANAGSGGLTVLRNLGAMAFERVSDARLNRWTIGTASPSVVFTADLDDDGDLDTLDFAGGSGRLDARFSSAGRFGAERAWDLPFEDGQVVGLSLATMADLNRDGRPELVTTVINSARTNPVYAWSIGAGGEVTAARFAGFAQGSAFSAATADLDGDGDAEVLSLSVSDGRLCAMENLSSVGGPVALGPPVVLLAGNFLRHVVPVDVDGDGRLDLAVCDYFDHRIRILRNLGSGASPSGSISPAPAKAVTDASTSVEPATLAERLLEAGPIMVRPPAEPGPRPVAASMAPVCGPSAGDCASVHAGPGCFTTPCCEKVCAILPRCCEVTWDSECVTIVRGECVGMVCPSRGDCAVGHGGPGCDDAACCELVRRLDPTCSGVWDDLCVELVALVCGSAAPTVTPPPDARDDGEPCYRAINQGCGRRSDLAHLPIVAGDRVRGSITGDGGRDVDAFLLQVTERRPLRIELRAEFPSQIVLAQGPCAGPLVTLDEAIGLPGGLATIERTLEPGDYRLTVGMAVATRT
ncbi:MAG: VCBS repeat-containing protein, partial [Actinobacteria bacterium]|nr:VCBS repeat-containing protein [Actinomycetota bacterium]